MPSQPVTLTLIDVAGNLQGSKGMIDAYVEQHPDVVRQVNFTTATAPELSSKIQAQQQADQVSLAIGLTGSDGLSAGIEQDLWLELVPQYEEKFPNLVDNYIEPAAQELADGYGILIAYGNFGPTFTYDPDKVSTPPKNTDELLQFAEQNPGQLMYARPANSGPGRSLLMGLPYILGDSDPTDPETWDNTWSFLENLGQYIDSYPSSTTPTFEQLGRGSRAMVASTYGWDMNVRVIRTVPKNFEAFALDDTTLIADGHYAVIPKGLGEPQLAVTLDLIAWMLRPEEQAKMYDNAYFYPGPAVKNVTLDMAPQESQDAVTSVQRSEFDQMSEELPIEMPLGAVPLVRAFEIWDERVGGGKVEEE
jgi:putative spermidine/putrescine transport system substrate-binding protein